MRAEFYRPEAPDVVVGGAEWNGDRLEIDAEEESVREAISRIFRPTPVLVEDPSLRSYGTAGPIELPPGSLRWFRSAAESRATAEGLAVRFASQGGGIMGWDPAGAYRTFTDHVERRERIPAAPMPDASG